MPGKFTQRFTMRFSRAKREKILPKNLHETFTYEQAVQLVLERAGVGILTQACAPDFRVDHLVVMPLSDVSLRFDTCLVMRAVDDAELPNGFGRSFLRRFPLPG
jgi:DNA-binding transcriptional LysR family regulator